jgi:hypothetical protein
MLTFILRKIQFIPKLIYLLILKDAYFRSPNEWCLHTHMEPWWNSITNAWWHSSAVMIIHVSCLLLTSMLQIREINTNSCSSLKDQQKIRSSNAYCSVLLWKFKYTLKTVRMWGIFCYNICHNYVMTSPLIARVSQLIWLTKQVLPLFLATACMSLLKLSTFCFLDVKCIQKKGKLWKKMS